jgi:hypothetical protein
MAKKNVSFMVARVNFEIFVIWIYSYFFLICCLCWKQSMHWSNLHKSETFLFDCHQILSIAAIFSLFKSYHKICLQCFQRIPRFGCMRSQQNAFEMQGDILGPQHLGCWIFMLWLCGLHFLGYLFKCPGWEDSSVPRHSYYACGCCKSLLLMFENYV